MNTKQKQKDKGFEQEHDQWLYTTIWGKILTYMFSLEWPYLISTMVIQSVVYLIFCLLFVFVEDTTPSIVFGIFFYVWNWIIWGYQIFTLVKVAYRRLDINVLTVASLLYLVTIQQYGVIYSVVRVMDPDSFVGMLGNFSRSSILGLGHFLAVETIAGLGTGAIFANNTTQSGFWFVGLNSVKSIVLLQLVVATLVFVLSKEFESRLKREDEHLKRLEQSENQQKKVGFFYSGPGSGYNGFGRVNGVHSRW